MAWPMRLFFMNRTTATRKDRRKHEADHAGCGHGDEPTREIPGRQAGLRRLRIRTEGEIEPLLDHDRDAEGGEQRGEQVAGDDFADDGPVEHASPMPHSTHEGDRHARAADGCRSCRGTR